MNVICRRQSTASMAPHRFSYLYKHIKTNILCRYRGDGAPDDFSRWCYPGPPHNLATWQFNLKCEIFVEQHPVITGARRGDLIRVMRYMEGRHGLEVRDFQMTLLHKNLLPIEEPMPADEPSQIGDVSPTDEPKNIKIQ